MSEVDLTKCKPGDVCIDRDGDRHVYMHKTDSCLYSHVVGDCNYTDDGYLYCSGINQRDIVRVIPAKQKQQPKWRVVVECESRAAARHVRYGVARLVGSGLKTKIERTDK